MIETEGGIGENAVELLQLPIVDEHWLAKRIFTHDSEFLGSVEEKVHSRNSRSGQILFLPVNLTV